MDCKHDGGKCVLKTPCKDCAMYPVVLEKQLGKAVEIMRKLVQHGVDSNFMDCKDPKCTACAVYKKARAFLQSLEREDGDG